MSSTKALPIFRALRSHGRPAIAQRRLLASSSIQIRPLYVSAVLRQQTNSDDTARSTSTNATESMEDEQKRRSNVLSQLRDVMHRKRTDLEPRIRRHLDELGRRWNAYSGYEEVQDAKALVVEAELELKELRERQTTTRQAYMQAISKRASSQRTLNELLTRKEQWSEADLSAYTELLKSEHGDARREKETSEQYEAIAGRVSAAWDDVVRKTLDGYHREQIWSDRVRASSTYVGLGIAGLNVAIFVLAFLVVEPYKRKRLAETFESRLLQGETVNAEKLAEVVQGFEQHVERLERHGIETNAGLSRLLAHAGLSQAVSDTPDEGEAVEAVQEILAGGNGSLRAGQTLGEKRRDMALAGALGFAMGAGILAALGALSS